MKPTAAQRKAMYSDIVRSREFDDRVLELYFADKMPVFDLAKGVIPGEIHSSHGQEPCAAGTMPHLTLEDTITSNHRPHHHGLHVTPLILIVNLNLYHLNLLISQIIND